jgi:outer membrane immunogenic protein
MKRIVVSTAAALALLNVAFFDAAKAGNMAFKAPPPPVAFAGWGGCYVGGNAGYGWTNLSADQTALVTGTPVTPPLDFGSQSASSFVGGGQFGCDYQVNSQWVVGIRGQFDYAGLKGQDTLPGAPTFYMNDTIHDIGTVTGRLGYIVAPGWLLYAQGGGAWVHNNLEVFGVGPPVFPSEGATFNRYGYAAGAGVEYMFAPNWSVFAEYNYLGFGTKNEGLALAPGVVGTAGVLAVKQDVQTAMLGVNWRFIVPGLTPGHY